MPYRDKSQRHPRHTNTTAVAPYFGFASTEFRFVDSAPRLTHRSVKITDRYNVEVIERKAGIDPTPFFGIPPKPAETTKRWSSEQTAEIEETYE